MREFITQYWIQTLFGIIVMFLGVSARYVVTSIIAMKLGLQAVLRNEIIAQYNNCMSREPAFTRIYEMTNMEHLYKQYHALGGNGAITNLYEDFLDLPTETELKHKLCTSDKCPTSCAYKQKEE